ncbi:hypothetical protein NG798_27050 [Ancylothrix sp. C2]|nr:hypothetical protein [Ancylothrix sp. D3o]MCT7953461.1 hypothetical protein [Ancylothrix sp. D3o]
MSAGETPRALEWGETDGCLGPGDLLGAGERREALEREKAGVMLGNA